MRSLFLAKLIVISLAVVPLASSVFASCKEELLVYKARAAFTVKASEDILAGTRKHQTELVRHEVFKKLIVLTRKWNSTAAAEGKYFVLPLARKFIGEEHYWLNHKNQNASSGVNYPDDDLRKQYKVHIENGIVLDYLGKPVDTRDSLTSGLLKQPDGTEKKVMEKTNKAIFVMDRDGNFYISRTMSVLEFHHSSLFNGLPVAAAGEIEIINGQIKSLNDKSGHYMPLAFFSFQVEAQFKKLGVDTSSIQMTLTSPKTTEHLRFKEVRRWGLDPNLLKDSH